MDILDRIILLLGTVDQKQLTDFLGLKKTAFTDWKSGKSNSYRKYLVEIADYFKVSLDYLVYGKEDASKISDDVKELLDYYNKLSDIDKGKLLGKAETLAELAAEIEAKNHKAEQAQNGIEILSLAADERPDFGDQEPEDDEEYYIDLCSLPASAGSGVQLDEGFTEPLRIKRTSIAERANYAVRVSGNSMEPKYFDGDIVLIETCPIVEIGEIGIFIVDDQGYIKKRGEDRLISLNPEYDDVFVQNWNTTYCRGRVLGKAEVID